MRLILSNGTELVVNNIEVEQKIVNVAMGGSIVTKSPMGKFAKAIGGNCNKHWTDKELTFLRQSIAEGKRPREIAAQLHRTKAAVAAKANEIKYKQPVAIP